MLFLSLDLGLRYPKLNVRILYLLNNFSFSFFSLYQQPSVWSDRYSYLTDIDPQILKFMFEPFNAFSDLHGLLLTEGHLLRATAYLSEGFHFLHFKLFDLTLQGLFFPFLDLEIDVQGLRKVIDASWLGL